MRLHAALLGIALYGLSAGATAVEAIPAKSTDNMQVRNGVLVIHSPSGVGSGQLLSNDGKWPAGMTVRLRGFREIEHFRATAGTLSLICALHRAGGVSTERPCRLGDKPAGAVKITEGGFELSLPPALFTSVEEAVVIEWVDYWR
ncbi:MAG: hypothetical protein KIS79_02940 [Burkholderiales bacterium]|nr:hypothetical protein [Burkholderiales bacterium]